MKSKKLIIISIIFLVTATLCFADVKIGLLNAIKEAREMLDEELATERPAISGNASWFQISRIGESSTSGDAWGICVLGDYAYVADSTNGIAVIDVSNPNNPSYYNGLNTSGISANVFVAGNYLYLADGSYYGLQIYNIDDLSYIYQAGYYRTTLAEDVYVKGAYAYIADSSAGFKIVNVTDPTSPAYASSYSIGGSASAVVVSGDYAYIAVGLNGLVIIDVSNPESPNYYTEFDTDGRADDVYVYKNYIYIADASGGLKIYRVSDLSLVGTYSSSNVRDVHVTDDYAYLVGGSYGITILDVSTPSSPAFIATYDPGTGTQNDVYVSGKYVYVSDSDSGLQIYETNLSVSVPEAPSNINVVNGSGMNLIVSWADNSDNEAGFKIERKYESGAFYEIGCVPAEVTMFNDPNLASGTYTYRVRAFNSAGNSDYSN